MKNKHKLVLIIGLTSLTLLIILLFTIFCCRRTKGQTDPKDVESVLERDEEDGFVKTEVLIKFNGGEDLSVGEILDAPGEVIAKSSHGTLYRASLVNSNSIALLRFLRPTCALRTKEVLHIVELLGSIRHPNLVPLHAFYTGPRGEKLMVHPFYGPGNLAHFIKSRNRDAQRWPTIYAISIGIAKGIHHLHSLEKPVIHGNLKSENVFLDRHHHPYVSDFGLHLLLNPTTGQQMLEASASHGYKAPEVIKMKDASLETDIYSFGIILLELLTGKSQSPTPDKDLYLPNALRSAVLDDRIRDLYHPDLLGLSSEQRVIHEDCIFRLFQLAMACCSPSRLLRPHIDEVLEKLQEIGINKSLEFSAEWRWTIREPS